MGIKSSQYLWRKMKSSRWCSHTSLDFRIDRLVGRLVALLSLAVEVWRDGKLADGIEDFGKCH